jgi:hypothetical protein
MSSKSAHPTLSDWFHERTQAAALGDGPLVMFDDGCPLQFLHGSKPKQEQDSTMGKLTQQENEWLDKATAASVGGARKIALSSGPLMNTPVGRLTDHEWGMIITAAIFGWVETRVQQAIAEGLDQEQAVRLTGLTPNPSDVAVVKSILNELADTARIDWSQPLSSWSPDTMIGFLMLAWNLIIKAETARDHGPGKILRKAEFNVETGDPIPF